jgi:flagellar motility protein MotE (MotC chaperone)
MEIRERQAAKILGAISPAAAAELTRLMGQAPARPS